MVKNGTGLALDESLDLKVGSKGGIASSEGKGELKKDLAFQLIVALSEYIGSKPSQNNKVSVFSDAVSVILADDRIDFVNQEDSEIEFENGGRRIRLDMIITTTDDTEIRLVREIE
jgi:hypothetical protein